GIGLHAVLRTDEHVDEHLDQRFGRQRPVGPANLAHLAPRSVAHGERRHHLIIARDPVTDDTVTNDTPNSGTSTTRSGLRGWWMTSNRGSTSSPPPCSGRITVRWRSRTMSRRAPTVTSITASGISTFRCPRRARRRAQISVRPPSTARVWPVM